MSDCPFDTILARTPYLVLPKLAIQAMPLDWRARLAALLDEAWEAGLSTPSYIVLRDEPPFTLVKHEYEDNPEDNGGDVGEVHAYFPYLSDPWANYRHGDAFKLSKSAKGD